MNAIKLEDVNDHAFQDRFWKQGASNGLCWEWQGAKSIRGYGVVSVGGMNLRAHRVSYVMAYGSISTDKIACHTCDNPSCVNPLHLYEGTDKDNTADCIARGRRGGREQKLSPAQVEDARKRYMNRSATQAELAAELGTGRTTMQRILHGLSYKNTSGPISPIGKRGRRIAAEMGGAE